MKIVVLTGAGISAESGIKTFRDAGGLWEGRDVMEVASPEGWNANRPLVLDFYNQRRNQLFDVSPNYAHLQLAKLEKNHDVTIITQNVDDLHERAGSSQIVHLHGELRKVRSEVDPSYILDWTEDLRASDVCNHGHSMRPHIVWFGEAVPMMDIAVDIIAQAEVVIIVGTSMQVYPAASLVNYAPSTAKVFYLDPKAIISDYNFNGDITFVPKKATEGIDEIIGLIEL